MIATPLHLHYPIAMEALANKRHVFVERMMADSIEHCKEMVVGFIKAEKVLQVGCWLRYHPTFPVTWKFIRNEELGKVIGIRCQWYRGSLRLPEASLGMDPKTYGYGSVEELVNWKLHSKYSRGILSEAVHDQLDAVNLILESDSATVDAVTITGEGAANAGGVIDTMKMNLDYAGVPVTFEVVERPDYVPDGWEAAMVIDGEQGRIVLAQQAPYAGLFVLNPKVPAHLWVSLATRVAVGSDPAQALAVRDGLKFKTLQALAVPDEELVPKDARFAVVVGKPTPRVVFISGYDANDLLRGDNSQPIFGLATPYELEMIDFKRSVLDGKVPAANGLVGLKSALCTLLAHEAIVKKQPQKVPTGIIGEIEKALAE